MSTQNIRSPERMSLGTLRGDLKKYTRSTVDCWKKAVDPGKYGEFGRANAIIFGIAIPILALPFSIGHAVEVYCKTRRNLRSLPKTWTS